MKLAVIIMPAVVGLAACVSAQPAQTTSCRTDLIHAFMFDQVGGRTLTVAHRGAHDRVPENSIASIERAIGLGASVVELDVRKTADGVYVLMHDSTLDRTTTGSGLTAEHTLAELKSLRLLDSDGRPSDQVAPTFAEALDVARGRVFVMIDSKIDDPSDTIAISKLVTDRSMSDQIILYDYDPATLELYKAALPGAYAMFRHKDPLVIDAYVRAYNPDIYHLEPDWNSNEMAEKFDKLGMPTWLNIFGDIEMRAAQGNASELETQLSYYPDLVQTDRPAETIEWLSARDLHPIILSDSSVPPCE